MHDAQEALRRLRAFSDGVLLAGFDRRGNGEALALVFRGAPSIEADMPAASFRLHFPVEAREQLHAGGTIEQPRDRQAVSRLEGPDRRLRLGRKDAIDRAGVKPEVL